MMKTHFFPMKLFSVNFVTTNNMTFCMDMPKSVELHVNRFRYIPCLYIDYAANVSHRICFDDCSLIKLKNVNFSKV